MVAYIACPCHITKNYEHFKKLEHRGAIPCKMKPEVNSQISKHELKPVLVVLIHQMSQKIVASMSLHLIFTFS